MIDLPRSSYYLEDTNRLAKDKDVVEFLQSEVEKHTRWGFWKCFDRARFLGHLWNHKRVYRVYLALGLNLRRKIKKRVLTRERQPVEVIMEMNNTWSIDFMSDTLYEGRKFRTFNVMDEAFREVLGIEIDTSLPAVRIVRALEQIAAWRGYPKEIRCDNGPEMLAHVFVEWCEEHNIKLRYIEPGEPNQNPFIERFNRTYRGEVLDAYLFDDLDQVRDITFDWMNSYNEERPHDALNGVPPSIFRKSFLKQNSTSDLSI